MFTFTQQIARFGFSNSVSFIGCGKMGSAILGGLLNSGKVSIGDISVHEKDSKTATIVKDRFGIENESLEQLMNKRKYVVLAVKPKSVFSTLN